MRRVTSALYRSGRDPGHELALEGDEHSRVEASDALRGLIDEITLDPQGDRLQITLKGNLAGMLRIAAKNGQVQLLVAGACSQRYLQLWSGAA